jgi:hypothetical protein
MPSVEEQLDQQTEDVQAKEPEETHDGFIALDKHQKDVNVQHKKFRDEERGRVAAEEKLATAEKALEEARPKTVDIPPIPDPHSETFVADIATRDEAIKQQADLNATNEQAVQQRKEKDEARLTKESAVLDKRVETFNSNLVNHGLNADEVKAAAEEVIGSGASDVFQDVLLDDKDGPLMVMYLKANPVEAEQINAMPTLELVNYLNTEIRPKALLLKPKTSSAPDPPITLTGGGAKELEDPLLEGITFD